MQYNIEDIKDYIRLEHPVFIKGYLWTWVFAISFFGILIAKCDPFTPFIYNILIPMIVIMDIWSFFIMFNIEKWQKLYILFVGVYSFALSIVFYVSFFKIAYLILGIKSPLFLIFSAAFYFFILIIGFKLHLNALKTGYYSHKNKKKSIKGVGIIAGMAGAGTLAGKILIRTTPEQTFLLIASFVALFLSYIMILGMHNIYKYYLIKKYEDYVEVYKLPKKKKL